MAQSFVLPRLQKYLLLSAVAAACLFAALPSRAELPDRFRDPEDNQFDLSKHLLEHRGMLPVPIVITEPALGYGGGLAAVYFDQPLGEALSKSKKETGRPIAPNISVLGGFKTENGSWGAIAGHYRTWDADRFRYLGGLAKAELQLDYFGQHGKPRAYQLEGKGLAQQLLVRAGDSDLYLGGRYILGRTRATFAQGWPEELGPAPEANIDLGRLSLIADHDTRDNLFSPGSGHFIEAELVVARPNLGDSSNYEQFNLRGYHWQPLGSSAGQGAGRQWVLGLRGEVQGSRGGAPFFALPFIKLRGIPAMRYQDQRTMALETELWWKTTPRWSLLAFGGGGRAWGQRIGFDQASTITAYGAGFRYLVASRLGLHAGLDIAHGPQGQVYYIQVGSAWR